MIFAIGLIVISIGYLTGKFFGSDLFEQANNADAMGGFCYLAGGIAVLTSVCIKLWSTMP